MIRIVSAKGDHFSIAPDRFLFVDATVMPKMTFHEPRLGMSWIDLEDTIEKDLGDLPSFFRDGPSSMMPINRDYSLIV